MKNSDITRNGIISVIIPVYQAEKYIERCVNSVLHQSYSKLEILLIDDGSSDRSLDICKELAEKDNRILVFHHVNKGVAVTRNAGLDQATGQFVYFLDSDDWIDENTLSEMQTAMENSDSDLSICGFYYIEEGTTQKCHVPAKGAVGHDNFMAEEFWKLYENAVLFNIGTKLYKRSVIEEAGLRFSTDMILYEDIRFCMEYLNLSRKIQLLDKPYYYYYKGNINSVTHGYQSKFWKSTLTYCNLLINRSNENCTSLQKAVLQCLYRAYLQECHNPVLEKKPFLQILDENCFPIAESLGLKNCRLAGVSVDQKIFKGLISHKAKRILWLLALFVSAR